MSTPDLGPSRAEQQLADQLAQAVPEDVEKIVVTLSDGSEKEFVPSAPLTSEERREAKLARRDAKRDKNRTS